MSIATNRFTARSLFLLRLLWGILAVVFTALFFLALPSLPAGALFVVSGPIFITLLLLFVSGVPLLEKSADAKHGQDPAYQAYKARTSIFIPLPPRAGR